MGLTFGLMSKPNKKKYSTDESNDKFICATSCMQGWRETQEDAHNCIIDYDTSTSYFAVYDGHGGSEVSMYTSEKLPDFLKSLDTYKNGNIEKALEEAFLKFDATLLSDDVNSELQKRRNIEKRKYERKQRRKWEKRRQKTTEKIEEVGKEQEPDTCKIEENVSNLYEEAAMPIEQVIEKYKSGQISNDPSSNISEKDQDGAGCSTSTVHIPESSGEVSSSNCSRRSKQDSKNKNSNVEKSQPNTVEKSEGSDSKVEDDEKSQPTKADKGEGINSKVEDKVDVPDSSVNTEVCSPSDSGDKKISSNIEKVESTCNSSKSDTSNSSSTPLENGEVVRKAGKGKAKRKTKGTEELKDVVKEAVKQELKRTAKDLYQSLLAEELADEESEEDESFVASNDESSGDDDDEDNENDETVDDADADLESGDEEEDDEEVECDDDEDDEDESTEDEENEDDDEDIMAESRQESLLDSDKPALDTGCTAVVAILKENTLYVANAGDSRCVVCRNGEAIEMSEDHKPQNLIEKNRIKKAGGYVSSPEGRVNGGLNLSRGLGDHSYKQNKDLSDREQMITALPDVKTLRISPEEDEFMILACDGIWNSMSSQEAVDFVKSRLEDGNEKLSQIFEEMFDLILAPNTLSEGCDNMTAILVKFKFRDSQKRPATESDESKSHKTMKTEDGKAST